MEITGIFSYIESSNSHIRQDFGSPRKIFFFLEGGGGGGVHAPVK